MGHGKKGPGVGSYVASDIMNAVLRHEAGQARNSISLEKF